MISEMVKKRAKGGLIGFHDRFTGWHMVVMGVFTTVGVGG